jgi:hypothetical protein
MDVRQGNEPAQIDKQPGHKSANAAGQLPYFLGHPDPLFPSSPIYAPNCPAAATMQCLVRPIDAGLISKTNQRLAPRGWRFAGHTPVDLRNGPQHTHFGPFRISGGGPATRDGQRRTSAVANCSQLNSSEKKQKIGRLAVLRATVDKSVDGASCPRIAERAITHHQVSSRRITERAPYRSSSSSFSQQVAVPSDPWTTSLPTSAGHYQRVFEKAEG